MNFFDIIIKRATNFSLQSYEINKKDPLDFFDNNDLFQLAVLISSRSLYQDIKKNKRSKTESSLSKYYSRAHLNPTPFGLFSSIGKVKWGKQTKISKTSAIRLSVTHDNLFLSSQKNKSLKEDWMLLKYSINPTVHFPSDNKIAFYNSKGKENDKIESSYVELDCDDELKWLINAFNAKPALSEIFNELAIQGFEENQIEIYLWELLDIGFFIEDFLFNPYSKKLENNTPSYLSGLISSKNHQINSREEVQLFTSQYLKEQDAFLKNSDSGNFSHSINSYDFELGEISCEIKGMINRYIDLTVSYNYENRPITERINALRSKIAENNNDGFIPITKIFNPYSGISYSEIETSSEAKLHDDILNLLMGSDKKEAFLHLPLLKEHEKRKRKLPATFSVIIEILKCKATQKEMIYIRALGGGSALNLISRFTDVNQELCRDIVQYEKESNGNKILADINCIGNFRSINISPNGQLHEHCLPINTSYGQNLNPIFISDLYINMENGKLRLVSKSHQKEVLPRKISAINPKLSDSEMYKFFCNLEMYDNEIYGINFDFNSYRCFKPHIARIYLDSSILLHPAQLLLIDDNYNFEEFKVYFRERILKFEFTKIVIFYDLKGNLTIDSSNDGDMNKIYDGLKARKHFYVSENIYELFSPAVESESGNYAHELIVSVKNTSYQKDEFFGDIAIKDYPAENMPILSDWMYFEVYCNSYADSEILKSIHNELHLKNKFTEFYFVHYESKGRVLRLRFKTDSLENKTSIIGFIDHLKLKNTISRYQILMYEPEIHRYGGPELMRSAECIFGLDSLDFIENVVLKDLDKNDAIIVAVLKIINYLELIGYDNDQMIDYCENCIETFSNEFELTADLRKEFNEQYARIKLYMGKYEYDSFVKDAIFKKKLSLQLEQSTISIASYSWLIIHMSMNRHFAENQRKNEFKSYYLAKCYLNQLKFKKLAN